MGLSEKNFTEAKNSVSCFKKCLRMNKYIFEASAEANRSMGTKANSTILRSTTTVYTFKTMRMTLFILSTKIKT